MFFCKAHAPNSHGSALVLIQRAASRNGLNATTRPEIGEPQSHVAAYKLATTSAGLESRAVHKSLRTAVLSISGEVRTQTLAVDTNSPSESMVCKVQVKMLIASNPSVSFEVYYVPPEDQEVDPECIAYMRASPNVKKVVVLPFQSPPTACSEDVFGDLAGSPCKPLMRQHFLYEHLRRREEADVYLHTRFDVILDNPLKLDELRLSDTFYVLRGACWMRLDGDLSVKGDINNQDLEPIKWAGHYTLKKSVPDWFFVGKWSGMSKALTRYDLFDAVFRGTTHIDCGPHGGQHDMACLHRQEELLRNALDSVHVRFALPVATIVRTPHATRATCQWPMTDE